MSVDFCSAGGFSRHTMYYCVCLAAVPRFMRKHLEPLAELEGVCRVGLLREERVRARLLILAAAPGAPLP